MYYTLECDYEDWEEEQTKNSDNPIKKPAEIGLFEPIKKKGMKENKNEKIKKEKKDEEKKEERKEEGDDKNDKRDERMDDKKDDKKDEESAHTPKNLRRSQSSSRELRNLLSDVRQTKPWSNATAKGMKIYFSPPDIIPLFFT